jgi:heptosyltransferase-3
VSARQHLPIARVVSGVRRRWSRALYAALVRVYRALFPSTAPPGRLAPRSIRRLLVVRHDAIGDMAVTLPALAYLRETLPDAQIDVVASPTNAPLVGIDPRVDRVFVNDRTLGGWWRTLRAVRARRYDVIVSALHNPHFREGLFAALAGTQATARVTAQRPKRYLGFFTHVVRVPHSQRRMARRLLSLVQHAIGDGAPGTVDPARYPPALAPSAEASDRVEAFLTAHVRGPFVALNAWGRDPARALGVALASEVAAGLARLQPPITVVLTPPPNTIDEARRIAEEAISRSGDETRIVVAPANTLLDLVELLRRAEFVVTPDTANVHLASAVGTPVVSLHTPLTADVSVWGPWNVPSRTVVLSERRPLREVSAEAVLGAVVELRSELARDRAP